MPQPGGNGGPGGTAKGGAFTSKKLPSETSVSFGTSGADKVVGGLAGAGGGSFGATGGPAGILGGPGQSSAVLACLGSPGQGSSAGANTSAGASGTNGKAGSTKDPEYAGPTT